MSRLVVHFIVDIDLPSSPPARLVDVPHASKITNPEEMKKFFENISGGKYAEKLFELFGQERVMNELDTFLSHNFFERFGAGIGVTRMARALKLNGSI